MVKTTIDQHIKIGDTDTIFGFETADSLIDRKILATRPGIHKNRKIGKMYNLCDVKHILFPKVQIEEYIS